MKTGRDEDSLYGRKHVVAELPIIGTHRVAGSVENCFSHLY